MLKRLLMPLMLILLLPQFMRAQDVAVYPIDVNAIITPPHGTCLKDYVGSRRFMVNVLLRDMTKRPDDFVVEMSVKNAGGRVVFRSYFGNLSLHPGKPAYLDSEIQNGFISQLFNENNISIGRGYATKCFEEGAYTISFQAFSAYHYPQRRIALSRTSATTLFMQSTVQGPYLIYPYNKDSIACSETVINFQWQSANPTGEPLSYQLQVAEVPEGVSANRAFEQNSVLVEDVQNLYHSIYQSVKTEGKYRADVTYAWRVLVNKLSGETHASPVYTFVYCGTPQVLEPEIPYDPVLSSKRMDYSLDSLHIDSVDTVSITPLAYWKNKPEIAGKGYCGIGIEVRKQGQDKWTPYIINTVDTTKFQLSNLSYGTLYEIRGQYIKCGEQDTLYGPYGDTLQFIIPDPNRAADCGDDIPPLTDCGDSKGKIMRVGDTINANGTSVIIDSLSYDEKDSTIITGKGHIEFPIIKNIRLWTKFEKIQINCAGELAKGNIVSIYDPRTAAMIDLEELTGENSTGGGDNPVANSTTEAYSKEKFDAAPAGSFFTKGDTVVMKDDSGNEEIIGREISLSSDEYASRNALSDDAHFLEFRNDIDPDNIAFDNDKDNIYSRIDQGKEGYHKFSNAGGRNYIIPWLANNPGKLKPLSVKDINLKGGSLFDSVKFVMPTNGKYIELSCETTGEGEYKISIPGGAGTRNSFEVYALGKMKGNSSYQDAGKLLIANYAPRTQKVIIVPVLREYAVSPDMEQQLNQIYGRLGVSYEVVLDKVFTEIDTVLIDSLKNGLKIGADDESRWQVETQEMKELRYSYQLAKGDALDKNAAYIFLVEKAEEPYVGIEGDMPRNQSVGYIFMNGKESLADGRLVAHELGHGVYKLQHTFAYKQLAETKGKTDNLMDYNGGSFLAHYQWRVMQDSVMFVWKVLQDDEDGMLSFFCWLDDGLLNDKRESCVENLLGFFDHIFENSDPGEHYALSLEKKETKVIKEGYEKWIASYGINNEDILQNIHEQESFTSNELKKDHVYVMRKNTNITGLKTMTDMIIYVFQDNVSLSEYKISSSDDMKENTSRVRCGYRTIWEKYALVAFYDEKGNLALVVQLKDFREGENLAKVWAEYLLISDLSSSKYDNFSAPFDNFFNLHKKEVEEFWKRKTALFERLSKAEYDDLLKDKEKQSFHVEHGKLQALEDELSASGHKFTIDDIRSLYLKKNPDTPLEECEEERLTYFYGLNEEDLKSCYESGSLPFTFVFDGCLNRTQSLAGGLESSVSNNDDLENRIKANFYNKELPKDTELILDENSKTSESLHYYPYFQKIYYFKYLEYVRKFLLENNVGIYDIFGYVGLPNFSKSGDVIAYDFYGVFGGTQRAVLDLDVTEFDEFYLVETKLLIEDWYGADFKDFFGTGTKAETACMNAFFMLQFCHGCSPFKTGIYYRDYNKIYKNK